MKYHYILWLLKKDPGTNQHVQVVMTIEVFIFVLRWDLALSAAQEGVPSTLGSGGLK